MESAVVEIGEVLVMVQGVVKATVVVGARDETAAEIVLLIQVVFVVVVVVVQRSSRDREAWRHDFFGGKGIGLPVLTRLSCSVPGLGGFPAFHRGQPW